MPRNAATVKPDIVEFITDPLLLGLTLSPAQETLLRGIYGLPLAGEQLDLWHRCTGRESYTGRGFGEVTVLAGARSGKDSRIAAPIVVYEALFGGHEECLSKGERAVIPLVAQDQRATRIAFGYIREYLTGSKVLASAVEETMASEVTLTNRVAVSCFPCTLRSLRGWSVPAGVLDEVAFYRLEGQNDSDAEVQASIRRGMLAFPEPRLVKISTPYMKGGILYDDFRRAWGQDNPDLLVWRAPSVLMNTTLTPERLERERRLDPDRYAREYEAEFAEDLDSFLPAVWVESAVIRGRHELPPLDGQRYAAAVDPSGGGADAFTLAIVHSEGSGGERRVVHDVLKAWQRSRSATVDLGSVVKEAADTLKRYRVSRVVGDKYSGQWVRQAFGREGINYTDPGMDRSTAYLEAEPLFAQGRLDLLDHPTLVRELKNLERRPRVGGRTIIDHPRSGKDDHANALALAAATVSRRRPGDTGVTL